MLDVERGDMGQLGPADYAMSLRKAGQKKDPEVVEAQLTMIKLALAQGVAPRVEIGSPGEAEAYLNLGVKHFSLGTDVTTIYNWSKDNGSRLRDILKHA